MSCRSNLSTASFGVDLVTELSPFRRTGDKIFERVEEKTAEARLPPEVFPRIEPVADVNEVPCDLLGERESGIRC